MISQHNLQIVKKYRISLRVGISSHECIYFYIKLSKKDDNYFERFCNNLSECVDMYLS